MLHIPDEGFALSAERRQQFPRSAAVAPGCTFHQHRRNPIPFTMQIRIVGLFTTKTKEAAVRKLLGDDGIDLVPAASIGALLAMLRDGEAEALLLEDAGAELGDWLGMLQLRAADAVPAVVLGTPAGMGMADALLHGAADYVDHDAAGDQLAARRSRCARARPRSTAKAWRPA
jgi:hypothetical protein